MILGPPMARGLRFGYPKGTPMSAPRVLIVRFSAIGDCVMAAWAATSIRGKHPDAFLCWAVEARCAPMVDGHQLVTQKVEFPRDKWKKQRWSPATWQEQLAKYTRMRSLRFDFGLDLQGHSKTALCLRVARPRQRISVAATDALARRLNPLLEPGDPDEHTVERNHRALRTFGEYVIPERPIMPEVPYEGDPNLVTLAVSAGQTEKAYPLERWGALAESLIGSGYRVAFLGGPTDRAPEVAGAEDYVGKLPLRETLALVQASRLHVASDTGTGHMAAAVGTPLISVFGPTDPAVFRPYTPRGVVLREGLSPADVPLATVEAEARRMLL
ncbi:MAG: lipopolysaccharide heptosyltransferase family protein [Acetobacteraceae bacterium]|nr:MAG: lipopolysaccharide heptosyltransferase family protein [Acetobacteraceae bacterium]